MAVPSLSLVMAGALLPVAPAAGSGAWGDVDTWFAVLFDLPQWLLQMQPWGHLPHLPRDTMS